jgi:hypothetical protein
VYEIKWITYSSDCPIFKFTVQSTTNSQDTLGFNIITFPSTSCPSTGICNKFDVTSAEMGQLKVQISQEADSTPLMKEVEIKVGCSAALTKLYYDDSIPVLTQV